MKKKILLSVGCFLTLCFAGRLPATVIAAEQAEKLDISEASITLNGSTCSDGCLGHIITQGNSETATENTITVSGGIHTITLSGVNIVVSDYHHNAFYIGEGSTVYLTLEGANTLNSSGAIRIRESAVLTITDSSTGSITNRSDRSAVMVSDYGIFNMSGGKITGNGTGVDMFENGTFNMSGGEITGNNTGVSVDRNAAFNMSGGEITANGTAVNVSRYGTFKMSGGEIVGNTDGVWTLGTFEMSGGKITETGNYGVAGSVTLSGTPIIVDNYKNIYLEKDERITIKSPLHISEPIGVSFEFFWDGKSSVSYEGIFTEGWEKLNVDEEKIEEYFFSDVGYVVQEEDGELVTVNPKSTGESNNNGNDSNGDGESNNSSTGGNSGESTGSSGNTGNSGNSGSNGSAGSGEDSENSGSNGNTENSGSSGNNGSNGNAGSGGNSGSNGNTGSSENTGNNGNTGNSGNSGNNEDTGSNGTTNDVSQNGWHEADGAKYWYEDGIRQGTEGRGKEIYDPATDAWYWLDAPDGKMAISKDVYQESLAGAWGDYVGEDGQRYGKWVRYDENGHMVKGWQETENGTYFFDYTFGTMAKGYATIDGTEYYFNTVTGVLEKTIGKVPEFGWMTTDGNDYWYENHIRQGYSVDSAYRGKEIYDPASDAWYWLDNVDGGKKATSKDVYQESYAGDWGDYVGEDGQRYGKWVRYDENGHMIKGWQTNDNGTYYFDLITGTMAKGQVSIDGNGYYFDETMGILR